MWVMPTKPSPLLCELHAHTTWSDGELTPRELCDLYGLHGFDVLAITDHTCREVGEVHGGNYHEYLADVEREAERALRLYGLLVLPGLELTYDDPDPFESAHVVAVGLREHVGVSGGLDRARALRARKGRRSSPPTRICRRDLAGSDARHRRVRRPAGAARARRPLRALQPRHTVRLGRRGRPARDRERRLPSPGASRRLEDAPALPAGRAQRRRLPALAAARVPRPRRRARHAPRGLRASKPSALPVRHASVTLLPLAGGSPSGESRPSRSDESKGGETS